MEPNQFAWVVFMLYVVLTPLEVWFLSWTNDGEIHETVVVALFSVNTALWMGLWYISGL